MEFLRSGQRDERRRRVLMDEKPAEANQGTTRKRNTTGPVKNYSDAAKAENQPPVTALLPVRAWSLWVLWLLAATFSAGVMAAYLFAPDAARHFPTVDFRGFDLSRPGNVGQWFSAMLLAGGGIACIGVYHVRRHRVDDYRGRYRIWLWTSALFALASFDAVAAWSTSLRGILLVLSGLPEANSGDSIWYSSVAVFLAAVIIRLAVDMRHCRLAMFHLLLAAGLMAGCAVVSLTRIGIFAGESALYFLAFTGLLLACQVSLLFSLLSFARYVYRDAQGELKQRKKKVRSAKTKAAREPKSTADKKTTKTSARSTKPAGEDSEVKKLAVSPGTSRSGEDEEEETGLSKAERRRQRKLKRRQAA